MKYKIKRIIVKFKQKRRAKSLETMFLRLNDEQISLFNSVADAAKKNNSDIVFDPHSSEIIITLPKILIVIDDNDVTIHNTKGFYSTALSFNAIEKLKVIIYKEAHKARRKLKHQAKERLKRFLDTVSNTI